MYETHKLTEKYRAQDITVKKKHESDFANLSATAKDFLSIRTSSTPVERQYFKASLIL